MGYQATWAFAPTFNSLPDFSDFSNTFDEYRITKVDIKVLPKYVDNTSGGDQNMAILGWFTDDNSADLSGFQSSENPWLQRSNYKQCLLDKEVNISFTPKVQQMMYTGLTSTAYSPKRSPWLQMSDWAVPHYGLLMRVYCPNAASARTEEFANLYITMHFQLKATK